MEANWIREKWEQEHTKVLALKGVSAAQRTTLHRLDRTWALKGHSLKSRSHKLRMLRLFALHLGKPLEKAKREDLERYLSMVQGRVKPNTLEGHKRVLKSTYKDLLQPEESGHPSVVSWIRLANPFNETKREEDLLRAEEVKRIAQAAMCTRDRAIILVLEESGARSTEIAAAHVGDVKFDQYGALISLGGDTDKRRVRLLHSVPDLARWMNEHPFRNHPDSPLWVSWGSANRLEALGKDAISKIVVQAAKVAGIPKHVHPHLFRHTRINHWLDKYNDDIVKYLAGWSKNSMMVQVYRHRAGKRFDRVILEKEGLLQKEDQAEPQPTSQNCPRCLAVNGPVDVLCRTCTLPLSEELRERDLAAQAKLAERWELLLKLVEDPEFLVRLKGRQVQKEQDPQESASTFAKPGPASPTSEGMPGR